MPSEPRLLLEEIRYAGAVAAAAVIAARAVTVAYAASIRVLAE